MATIAMTEHEWHARVPKVELHLHLEGAIPLDALWQLVQKYGGDASLGGGGVPALEARFRYRDFPHFIDTWVWKNGFLREYEDFTLVAEAVARDLRAQNIHYVEAFYSPGDFARHGLAVQELTAAIRAGLDRVLGIEVALVADLVRDFGPARGAVTLEQLRDVKHLGVVGIGIGGSEHAFPPEPYAAVFESARALGFHTSAHAGEAAGAASIWGALRSLQVERIGHGTRAWEDPRLLDHLAEHRVALEMCPLSNLRTGVVATLREHPARRYVDHGIVVTINTDDPKMFGNTLAEEYRLLETEQGFTREGVRGLILQGIAASWLPEDRKRQLHVAFTTDAGW